eukprot:jgi/Chrzof1/14342/UNPLg00616.t1
MGHAGEALIFLLPTERAYVDLLQQKGVRLQEEPLSAALRCLPALSSAPQRGSKHKGPGVQDRSASMSQDAMVLQHKLTGAVATNPVLKAMAEDAFRSFIRAYSAHPTYLKPIFHVKSLHLGHVAASFGLSEPPTRIGHSGSKAERKKRKQEAHLAHADTAMLPHMRHMCVAGTKHRPRLVVGSI